MELTLESSSRVTGLRECSLDWPRSVEALISKFAKTAELAWLDSSGDPSGGILAVDPVGVLTFDAREGAKFESSQGEVRHSNAWSLWREVTRKLPGDSTHRPGPGWFGYVGYEMARTLERNRVPQVGRSPLPSMRMALHDRAVVLSARSKTATLVWSPEMGAAFGRRTPDVVEFVERWNAAARLETDHDIGVPAVRIIDETPRETHRAAVLRAKEYIAAGDVYQVNLARRLVLGPLDDPISAYLAIRRSNPTRLGAFLKWDGGAVASVSPESFLRLVGRTAHTSPIKGTRPRTGNPESDAVARAELIASEKDAAELAMIVDLHRNDLGRVCEWGSVRVRNARRIEEHPTVFHTVADVDGTLAEGRDAFDLIAACFPAGSVTGVPKIRAMEIISELEQIPRGVYTGAIGYLGLSGDLSLNVAIRTLQLHDGIGTLHTGGGIVADSDADAEYHETLAKSRGILRALGVHV